MIRLIGASWVRAMGLVAGLAAALLLAGCAKVTAPIGGEVDREPPRVVATDPEPFAVVPELDRPVVIKFDERISERRIGEAVLVSPETGAVRVKKGRSELRVSLEGGWRPGQIYRVVILPVLQDLFNNPLKHEIELIFSTGPEIPATVVAGVLTDRLTGQPATAARVEAMNEADSVSYVALSDTAGFFALRHIPAGNYDLRAYLDRNQSRKLDYGEPMARTELRLGAADTTISSYALLAADTTPARVVRAEARDSMQVRIALDDHLDPEESLDGVRVELRELPDSIVVPGAPLVVKLHEFERQRAKEKAAADSARAAEAAAAVDSTAAADSSATASLKVAAGSKVTAVARDSARLVASTKAPSPRPDTAAGDTGAAGVAAAAADTVAPLPTRELVVIPAAPLTPKARYLITISGVRNINGVDGGGGSVTFTVAAAAPPDSTAGVPADSARVPADSVRVPVDSARVVPPDTTGGGGRRR